MMCPLDLPQSGHSGLAPPLPEAPARSWGQPTRYGGVKADGTELAEGVSSQSLLPISYRLS
jgi:hypothetical protein